MANLGSGNDNINIDGATASFIDFGGSDTYTVLNSLSGDVTLTDNQASTINLPTGLTISDALFLSDGVQFTVNGNTVTLIGNPSLFTFIFGGTPLDPTAGTPQTFAETAVAFGTTIPASGAVPNSATNTGEINDDGSVGTGTTPPPVETFALAAAASVDEGATATFTLNTTNVAAGTEVTYTISGVSASDIVGPLTGSATVDASGSTNIGVQIVADQLTEGPETLTLSLDNGEASANVTVLDTSVAPGNTYISGQGGNGVVSNFNIEIVFEGAFSTTERAAFETAADYLSALIPGDLPDEGAIDDIRIIAELEPIDGPFGTLAFAGPTVVRFDSVLPSEAEMTFDTADTGRQATEGSLTNTVVHEMIHALGFGTIWSNFPGLVTSGPDVRFTGDNAIAAYNAEFPAIAASDALSNSGVPLEGGHWSEAIFTTEILTPTLNSSADFMSGMTVASLEDLGYDTIFDVSIPGATMPQLTDFMMA